MAVPHPDSVSSAAPAGSAARAGSLPRPVRAVAQVRPASDSVWWLVLVAAAFTASQLAFVVPKLALSWDETVYISQVAIHSPAAYFDPARARGIPVLVAPVTLLTSSVLALRIYLSLASGLALLLALLVWRPLRPVWQLALGGAFFASLWVTQYYGPQAMPDLWVAFSALAAVGFFLRAAGEATRAGSAARPSRGNLAGLAACIGVAALVRPGDALYLGGALGIAVLAVRAWRSWPLLVAIAAGFVAGAAEWVIEAYVRFGSPQRRLHLAGLEQGGFGFHWAIWDELRALNGPTLCRPCTVGLRYPEISLWWLALPVLVFLGALAARRAGRLSSSVLAAVCGVAIAFQYLFLIGYAAPRFLLPAYALLSIPVSDLAAGLITGVRRDLRPGVITLIGVALVVQVMVQNAVLTHQVSEKAGYFGSYGIIAADLHRIGVRGPCLIKGVQYIPIAFYAGCDSEESAGAAQRHHAHESLVYIDKIGKLPPTYARGWTRYQLPGIRSDLLNVQAYVSRSG
jgi:hypothetical protein